MDLKRLLMQRGYKQIELAKILGANHSLINLQLNKHRLLPGKYQERFCEILGITKDQLHECMKAEGGKNE